MTPQRSASRSTLALQCEARADEWRQVGRDAVEAGNMALLNEALEHTEWFLRRSKAASTKAPSTRSKARPIRGR